MRLLTNKKSSALQSILIYFLVFIAQQYKKSLRVLRARSLGLSSRLCAAVCRPICS